MTPIESVFYWLEHTDLSMWVRGPSLLVFPLIVSAHTLGMGFLAGTSAGIDFRILGVAKQVPLSALQKFYPIMWAALVVNFISGTLLLIGYPWKAVTNPIFYVKLSMIALGVYLVVKIRQDVLNQPDLADGKVQRRAKLLASISLLAWASAIFAGRLLAYTYTWLEVGTRGGILMFEEPDLPAAWELWVRATFLHQFVAEQGQWLWPVMETLHYLGLSLLLGTIGLFDLRVLGLGKAIPPATLHKLIPIGIAGYAVNALTGLTFFSGFPEQYFYNPSFWWKGTFMAIAGMNVAIFYLTPAFREVQMMPAGSDAPFRAKIIAGTSLGAWIAVLICGRLLTFYRPPFFH